MANSLNPDGSVSLDSDLVVRVNKTVVPAELRKRKQQIKAQIEQGQLQIARMREMLAQIKAEIAACVAAGAPSDPSDGD